ncbi:hypothetical protein LIER_14634 [Lithospermum erythrorhizon]|uniref:DYW domain-containing protein n=1 Tax=Lithospermum erythrorhizon TaxID=34254 RepID=A0AAV3PZZ5_LITER
MSTKTSDPRCQHAEAITTGSIKSNRAVSNNLITSYSRSNQKASALKVFQTIPSPNIVSWTSLISSFSNSSNAILHFISMLRHPTTNILPNARIFASLFKTCASISGYSFAFQLHSVAEKVGLSTEVFTGSALASLYCKAKCPDDARKVFDEISERDSVCYSSMVVGMAQNGKPVEALSYFVEMRRGGFASTMYSVSGAFKAVSEMATLEQCRIIHGHSVVIGMDLDVVVGTSLIDGYGKCGLVKEARGVFNELEIKLNLIGWNAMMAAYAQHGDIDCVIELFGLMDMKAIKPDEYSLLAVMSGFCNAGFVQETERWFKRMVEEYGLEPWIEHYTCLVTALGKQGRFEEAEKIALTMPYKPDAVIWRALLSTSAYGGNTDIAWRMSEKLLDINPYDDSAYVLLANGFAGAGRWDEVKEVWKRMKDRRVRKEGGRSWIEVRGEVHEFLAGDRRHDRKDEIYAKLEELMESIEKLGYKPVWSEVLHEVDEREKREVLMHHSEKLAFAFGVLDGVAPPGKAMRIVKNVRSCRDCHEAFKYFSIIYEREIIVRDVNRYHRFLNGNCSCGDQW